MIVGLLSAVHPMEWAFTGVAGAAVLLVIRQHALCMFS
jgi:hypothetical protein